MTGKTRDYLADLANKKGITLPGMQDASQAEASAKIDELKALPDEEFPELSKDDVAEANAAIREINEEMQKWTFER